VMRYRNSLLRMPHILHKASILAWCVKKYAGRQKYDRMTKKKYHSPSASKKYAGRQKYDRMTKKESSLARCVKKKTQDEKNALVQEWHLQSSES